MSFFAKGLNFVSAKEPGLFGYIRSRCEESYLLTETSTITIKLLCDHVLEPKFWSMRRTWANTKRYLSGVIPFT